VRIKLDENLPHQLVQLLTDLVHDVDTVPAEHLAGRDDDVVGAAAQTAGRFLVTQDLDFSDARKMRPARTRGFSWSDCLSLDGAHSFSTLFRTEASRLGWAASSRPLPGRASNSAATSVRSSADSVSASRRSSWARSSTYTAESQRRVSSTATLT